MTKIEDFNIVEWAGMERDEPKKRLTIFKDKGRGNCPDCGSYRGGKICPKCGRHLCYCKFNDSKIAKDGKISWCKECDCQKSKKKAKKNREINKNKTDEEIFDGRNIECPGCSIQERHILKKNKDNFRRKNANSNGLKIYCKQCEAIRIWEFNHLTSFQWYLDQYNLQKGGCWICGIHKEKVGDGFKVNECLQGDHDHKTGKMRALLCFNCNTGIGKLRDNPYILIKSLKFLEEHKRGD